MKVLSVVGARPQFIKAAMVSRAVRAAGMTEVLVHTGQHYDENMSKIFFDDMQLPRPDCDLGVGSGTHAYQTGETMTRLEPVCSEHKPDAMLIYGDTNATLAGALVGCKLNIPIAHIEAGLRSFDRTMPEEINRILADRVSTWLFCPTETAVKNLANEGITEGVHNVGDVMYDAALHFGETARGKSTILQKLGLEEKSFVLVTIHRDFNTDNCERLTAIIDGLIASGEQIVFPAHPRVRKQLKTFGLFVKADAARNMQLIEPVGYLDMIRLEMAAKVILTDSGGVQKEAFFHRVPCVTVRPSTEWVETVESGWNRLVDANGGQICHALRRAGPPAFDLRNPFGDGRASERVATVLPATSGECCARDAVTQR